jgi:hypothetical protein
VALLDVTVRHLLAAAGLLLASCTAPAPAPAPSPDPRYSCPGSLGEQGPPSPDLETFLNAVALPTRRELQPNDHGDGWLFAKVGLYVRPDRTVELSVEPATDAGVEYGPGDRAQQAVLRRCTEIPDRWVVYTGGYYVREPMCLTVRVRVDGAEALAHVPVGAACATG